MKRKNVYQKNTIIAIYNDHWKNTIIAIYNVYYKNTIIAIYNKKEKCLLEKYNNCNLQ